MESQEMVLAEVLEPKMANSHLEIVCFSISDGLSKWPHQVTDLEMKLKVIKDCQGGKTEADTLQPCPSLS